MENIENKLDEIKDYCFLIKRNSDEEWWELEIGIPSSWEVKDNKDIGFTILNENNVGKQLHVFPKKNNVSIDDLILYVKIIIKTNEEISEKEEKFTEFIKKEKENLENSIKKFYEKLEEDKINAFKNLSSSLDKTFTENKQKKVDPKIEKNEKESVESKE